MPELLGNSVLYRRWLSSQPKAVILLVHGLGAHSARWNFLAEYFNQNQYSLYAIELKGFGRTPERPRGHIDSFKIYYQDILELTRIIKSENHCEKIFVLGESLGGLISIVITELYPETFAGLICISPAFANGMKFTLGEYFNAFSSLLYNRQKLISLPFTSAMCTRDINYQKIMDTNPDELRQASSKLLFEIMLAQLKAASGLSKLTLPTLFLLAGKDYLVDEKTNKKVFPKIKSHDKTLIEYPEMLHALSIDLERDKVFADILNWLGKRV